MTGQHRAPRPPSRAGRRAVAVAGSVALLTVAGTGTALACSPSESGSSGSSARSGASSSASTSSSSSAKASRPDPKFGRFKDVNADDDVNVRGVAAVSARNGNRSRVAATVRGLDPDRKYVALYYASSNCDVDGAQPVGIATRYRVSENGRGVAVGTARAAINDIGSISVREQVGKSRALNDTDLVPKACARVR